MIFRQLFDAESSTYTYLLADAETREAILIDPVKEHVEQYLALRAELNLKLKYTLDTHVHADHITGSGLLRQKTGCDYVLNHSARAECATIRVKDGDELSFGRHRIQVLHTPGHTPCMTSYIIGDRVFTGDGLLINGCGRTDFQGGSAEQLWDSITGKLFKLPDETLVYPAHDYKYHHVSSIQQEKETNQRILGKTKEAFIRFMNELNLPDPKKIHEAVPANEQCGLPR